MTNAELRRADLNAVADWLAGDHSGVLTPQQIKAVLENVCTAVAADHYRQDLKEGVRYRGQE